MTCKNCGKKLGKHDELGLRLCVRCDKILLDAKELENDEAESDGSWDDHKDWSF